MKMIWRWIRCGGALKLPPSYKKSYLRLDHRLHRQRLRQSVQSQWDADRWLSRLRPGRHGSGSEVPLPPVARRCAAGDRRQSKLKPAVAVVLSVLTVTAALGQRFYRQPELQVGTVSPKTVIAPEQAAVYDSETTESRRAAARNGAVPILVPDPERNEQIRNALDNLVQQANSLREQAGRFPFLPVNQLSTSAQRYIREAPSQDWDALWSVVLAADSDQSQALASQEPPDSLLNNQAGFRALTIQQQRVARELIRYFQQQSPGVAQTLPLQIKASRKDYQDTLDDLVRLTRAERSLPNDPELLWLSDKAWFESRQALKTVLDLMLVQGIAEGVPADLLAEAGQAQLENALSDTASTAIAGELLAAVLEPNLVEDPDRTREKAEAAAEQVPEVTVTVQAGAIIVQAGDTIDQSAFVLLDHFELSQRRLNLSGLVGFGILVVGATSLFLLAERTVRPALRDQDHILVISLLLGVSGLGTVGLSVYSLPAVGLLVSSFYGSTLGVALVGLLSILLPIGTRVSLVPLIASAAGALVCSLIAPRLRSREEIALLGGIVGLIQGAVYLALTWITSPVSAATWYLPITGAILQGIYGIVSSVVALGLSPYLEHLFDLVTPIRLAELSSPNRPMLKRLASEAPGTFQHTLFVASLAEAAARALSCNVELVRAGTLYHDIGKMHDPLGFIENQMGGPNKHDEIDDPWLSASIIKKHVSEGLIMARRCRLPKAIRAFIPEHQGTMLISYFYHQAKERADGAAPSVKESDFRYDGPIPQSPETGIVMLADSCEAALRSLDDVSTEEALAMVNRILKARWRDQQMIDSGLTRDHMAIIAQVFVQVWQQYHHKRIAYPKSSLNPIANPS